MDTQLTDNYGRQCRVKFRKALREYGLIADGDHILVGLSGGKDSLCLLALLGEQQRILKPSIRVEAAHIRMKGVEYKSDTKWLESFCQSYGVPLHIIETGFTPREGSRKPVCFLCSWHRRKALFELAQRLGCNRIALGHHQDDIIHTALMNAFFAGQFSSMPPKLEMKKMPLSIIRPLCLTKETALAGFARELDYQEQQKKCPYEAATERQRVRRLFADIEAIAPDARNSIWHALGFGS